MSSDARTPYAEALAIATEFVALIRDQCEEVEIAGSLRRQKQDVGDIEVVCKPKSKQDLFTLTDQMVRDGTVTKAVYQNNTHRWGDKYRGMMFRGMKVELWLYDDTNKGYITWLRTGPGDANTAVMTKLNATKSHWRAVDGHLYYSDSRQWTERKGQQYAPDMELIPIPDERAMFRVLGMDYVEPQDRTENRYMKAFAGVTHHWGAKPHVCRIWTGRINTNDPDALDITIKSASTPEGQSLAPTWDMVMGVKNGEITPEQYTERYLNLLRSRYRHDAESFHNILKRDRVVCCCYCAEGQFCHRHIAVEVLAKIAKSRGVLVEACGELQPKYRTETMFG